MQKNKRGKKKKEGKLRKKSKERKKKPGREKNNVLITSKENVSRLVLMIQHVQKESIATMMTKYVWILAELKTHVLMDTDVVLVKE